MYHPGTTLVRKWYPPGTNKVILPASNIWRPAWVMQQFIDLLRSVRTGTTHVPHRYSTGTTQVPVSTTQVQHRHQACIKQVTRKPDRYHSVRLWYHQGTTMAPPWCNYGTTQVPRNNTASKQYKDLPRPASSLKTCSGLRQRRN